MPYFLYKIKPSGQPEKIDAFDKYQDAKKSVRGLRAELDPESGITVKMVFARNPEEGLRLLKEKREPPPKGMDYEF